MNPEAFFARLSQMKSDALGRAEAIDDLRRTREALEASLRTARIRFAGAVRERRLALHLACNAHARSSEASVVHGSAELQLHARRQRYAELCEPLGRREAPVPPAEVSGTILSSAHLIDLWLRLPPNAERFAAAHSQVERSIQELNEHRLHGGLPAVAAPDLRDLLVQAATRIPRVG
jgi:hypothetical protein